MSAQIRWSGLQELLRELNQLPEALRREGHQILVEEAHGTAAELVQAYPRRTGTLAARVRVIEGSSDVIGAAVVSASPHSHLWHWGTDQRRTARGVNRGRMPKPNPEPLVPIARRRRLRARRRLVEMLERKGFDVARVAE